MAGRQKGEGGSLLQMTNSDADEMMNGAWLLQNSSYHHS